MEPQTISKVLITLKIQNQNQRLTPRTIVSEISENRQSEKKYEGWKPVENAVRDSENETTNIELE